MKIINYSYNVEKIVKNEALFVQSLNENYCKKKQIVYSTKKISIQSLFVSI